MAWTNWGFDGTINEAQWSKMANLLGSSGGTYMAAGNGDCLVTAVGGSRAVSVAAGTLYGDGIVSVNSAPETVAMTTPVNGQWYVIALRRTWSSNTAALVAIAGATTTTTTPTAPPTSFPTMNTDQGVLTDQPIAWAWCNSANTTVVVYDLRLKGVKSTPPVVLTQAERDAKFPAPTQGVQVWRDDLGAVETYFGLYNSSTNPGGRDAAGWYVNDRQTGLIPIKATTITAVGGTATANALGQITFTNCTEINFDGVFTSKYANYKIEFDWIGNGGSAGAACYFKHRIAGGDAPAAYYNEYIGASGTSVSAATQSAVPQVTIAITSNNSALNSATVDVIRPYVSGWAQMRSASNSYYSGSNFLYFASSQSAAAGGYDGFKFIIGGAGNMSGTVRVYGVN